MGYHRFTLHSHSWSRRLFRSAIIFAGALLVSSCDSTTGPEDPDPYFIKTYSGAWRESARGVVECEDGGFLLAGDLLRRTDRFGNELWTSDGHFVDLHSAFSGAIYGFDGGPVSVTSLDCEGAEVWKQVVAPVYQLFGPKSVVVTSISQFLVQTSMTGLALVDDQGTLVWNRSYECPDMTDYYHGVAASPDGGFLLYGRDISEGYTPYRLRGVKVDSEGGLEWQRMLEPVMGTNSYAPTGGGAQLLGIADGYLLLDHGYTLFATEPDSIVHGTTESTIRKLDPDGGVVWSMSFFRPDDPFRDRSIGRIISTHDGGIAAVGSRRDASYLVPYLAKLDGQGNIQWEKTYGSIYARYVVAGIHQASDGGFVMVGSQVHDYGYEMHWDPLIIRTNASGDI